MYLAKKHFQWVEELTDDKESAPEFQEAVAKALLYNQHLSEARTDPGDADYEDKNPDNSVKHPKYKSNLCRLLQAQDRSHM